MKVTAVETLSTPAYPNVLWVLVHTDDGLSGLGETFFGPEAVAEHIHRAVAPYLLGEDPRAIERHHSVLGVRVSHRSTGVEARGLSAVDIALWDLYGQSIGLPLFMCLGGPVRDRIRLYNTCAGPGYYTHTPATAGTAFSAAWGLSEPQGLYDDLSAWHRDGQAGGLAQSLLEMGITGMKIWPFDEFADETDGQYITQAQLERGLRPFRQIREAVGDRMEIAVELHSRWSLPAAIRIAGALEEIHPLWYEDPIRMDDPDDLAAFARSTNVPTAASETLAGRYAFRKLLERNAVGVVIFDPGWIGGISEARRVVALAETYHRPVAPHDCTGPVVFTVGSHLCAASPNAMLQEGVRAYYLGWYGEVLTELPAVVDGHVTPPNGAGLGAALRPEFRKREDVMARTSRI